jgi:hypothetical protein
MRLTLLLVTALTAFPILVRGAETNLWKDVSPNYAPKLLAPPILIPAQRRSIIKLLKSDLPWDCDVDDPRGEWLKGLTFEAIPLSQKQEVILVEAGTGCAREVKVRTARCGSFVLIEATQFCWLARRISLMDGSIQFRALLASVIETSFSAGI